MKSTKLLVTTSGIIVIVVAALITLWHFFELNSVTAGRLSPGVVIGPDEDQSGAPGDMIVYSYTITNTGDVTDTFTIAPTSQLLPAVTAVATVILAAQQSTTLPVTVTIPITAAIDLTDVLTIEVTSALSISVQAVTTNTTTVITGVVIEPKVLTGSVYPGDSVMYVHTVTNTGRNQQTFVAAAAVDSPGFTASVTPPSFILDGQESLLITVTITPPNTTAAGTTDTTTVTVTRQDDSQINDSAEDITTVQHRQIFLPLITTPSIWQPVATGWPEGKSAVSFDICTQGNEVTMFAGTSDALWHLDGTSWVTVSEVPADSFVSSIVFDNTCTNLFVSFFTAGVWRGVKQSGSWNWTELKNGGNSILTVRSMVLVGEVLFVGNDSGILSWQSGTGWQLTNVSATASQPIMYLSAANPQDNSGPLYAVQWLEAKVYQNTTPSTSPGSWTKLNTIADPPQTTMRSVFGDENNVQALGTMEAHYRRVNNGWQQVQDSSLRAYARQGSAIYVGYADGLGVYFSADGISYHALNNGWPNLPERVDLLVIEGNTLFAATTKGVWQYVISP